MTKVKLFRANSKDAERVEFYTYETKLKLKDSFRIINEAKKIINDNNLLGLNVESLNITKVKCGERCIDTISVDGKIERVDTGTNSCLLGNFEDKNLNENGPVIATNENGEEYATNIYFSLRAYESGLALSTNQFVTSMFGMNYTAHFKKLVRRNTSSSIKLSVISDAKLFKNYSALLKYVRENKDLLSVYVAHYGYQFTVKAIHYELCKGDKPEVITELLSLIEEINETEEIKKEREVPDYITPEILNKEALKRLEDLKVMDYVKRNFKNDQLMMSELGGILYYLNEDAQRAVEKAKEFGLPYHVVNHPIAGQMTYAVLYVSKNPEDWRYERIDRQGYMDAAVYMPDFDSFDIGSIRCKPANGGVTRIG